MATWKECETNRQSMMFRSEVNRPLTFKELDMNFLLLGLNGLIPFMGADFQQIPTYLVDKKIDGRVQGDKFLLVIDGNKLKEQGFKSITIKGGYCYMSTKYGNVWNGSGNFKTDYDVSRGLALAVLTKWGGDMFLEIDFNKTKGA